MKVHVPEFFFKWSPFVKIKKVVNGSYVFSGSAWNLFTSLVSYLDMPYVLIGPKSGAWGVKDNNGTWNGMLGMVQRKSQESMGKQFKDYSQFYQFGQLQIWVDLFRQTSEVDFAIGPFVITHERFNDFEFTTPVHVTELTILTKQPTEMNRLEGFTTPFTFKVWIYLMLTVLAVGVTYFALSTITMKLFEDSMTLHCFDYAKNLLQSIWVSSATFLQQSLKRPPRQFSNQVLFGFWSLTTLTVSLMYGSTLLTHITLPATVKNIESLEQLANHPTIYPGVMKGGASEEWFKDSKRRTEKMIWKRANEYGLVVSCLSSSNLILNDNLAVICQKEDASITIAKDFSKTGRCNFHIANNQILSQSLSLAFPKNSSLISKVNKQATGVSRAHHLQVNSKLPAQKILLTSSKNKKQLMQLIVDDFVHDKKFHEDNTQHHKLVVTGADPVPIEISEGGVVISRADLSTSHEEADNVIIQQVLSCAAENAESKITVVADDTDVFVLLLHYHHMANLKNVVLMESPIKGRAVLDIGKTVQKHCQIVEGILPAHTLSGCDTVASYFKIGKATVLKTLRSGHSLNLLGAPGHSMESVIQQATSFISACYGQTDCSTMPETRLKVWLSQTGKGSSTPKLCTLPPTTEAFKENVKRAHYQALVWRSLEAQNPPELDSTEYGWVKDDQNNIYNIVGAGLMRKWIQNFSPNSSFCEVSSNSIASSERSFTLQDLKGIFYVWIAGILTSTLLIVIEIFVFKIIKGDGVALHFYLLERSILEIKVCSSLEGAVVNIVKGEEEFRKCSKQLTNSQKDGDSFEFEDYLGDRSSSVSSSEQAVLINPTMSMVCNESMESRTLRHSSQCRKKKFSSDKIIVRINNTDGYYILFSSNNILDIIPNELDMQITLHKSVYKLDKASPRYSNVTSCEVDYQFASTEHLVVEIPDDDRNLRIDLITSSCVPRRVIYLVLLISILIMIMIAGFYF
ncbi:Glutamate receptor U1 [Nymphon striatum]|nr:Glutamate receptor U1 [Nymphon striatum]